MKEQDFIFHNTGFYPYEHKVSVQAPSNIALIKYWGKHGVQLPDNASLSFTLSQSYTESSFHFIPLGKTQKPVQFEILYEGRPVIDFRPKIEKFFERIFPFVPYLSHYHIKINTRNTFPHSSGIASSASAMAAMAAGIMSLERKLDPSITEKHFYTKASFLARLGSGSAARSIKGHTVIWGKETCIPGSTDLYGIPFPYEINPVFQHYNDSILLVDEGVKSISSSRGHATMQDHIFSESRHRQAKDNLCLLTGYLREGNISGFINIVESEALTLHALMMSARNNYILMKAGTLSIIHKIREFRSTTGLPVCFTLDAGANVHVLYPETHRKEIREFIRKNLVPHTAHGKCIHDQMGNGVKLS